MASLRFDRLSLAGIAASGSSSWAAQRPAGRIPSQPGHAAAATGAAAGRLCPAGARARHRHRASAGPPFL